MSIALAGTVFPEQLCKVSQGLIIGSVLIMSVLTALSVGAFAIPVSNILMGGLTQQQEAVLFSIRLPRVLLAGLVGAGLAVCGASLQGLFRNPLADPQLIGVSSGAALAVAVMIVFMSALNLSGIVSMFALSFAAFLGGLATCFIIFKIASVSGRTSVAHMLLAGIAISAIAFSGIGFLSYISDDQQLRAITFWTMGSLGSALWTSVWLCALIVIPCCFWLFRQSQALNIMQLGEEESRYLGIDPEAVKNSIIIAIALCVGVCVSVSGIIGFVGLVVPHLIRLSIGPDHRQLLPLSALLGAALLIIADTLSRTIVSPAEMPVGILTALIGGPYFLWLLMRQYKKDFTL
jgi:iron complex transport system permease protein